jgi:hypothetical protein
VFVENCVTAPVIMVKNAGVNYSGLVDARVRIRANAAPTFNSRRQMISLRLMCPGLATIKMMEAMPGGIVAWIEQRSSFPSSQQIYAAMFKNLLKFAVLQWIS